MRLSISQNAPLYLEGKIFQQIPIIPADYWVLCFIDSRFFIRDNADQFQLSPYRFLYYAYMFDFDDNSNIQPHI